MLNIGLKMVQTRVHEVNVSNKSEKRPGLIYGLQQ
jgi:hypothetical protein